MRLPLVVLLFVRPRVACFPPPLLLVVLLRLIEDDDEEEEEEEVDDFRGIYPEWLNIIYNMYLNIIFHDTKRQVGGNF